MTTTTDHTTELAGQTALVTGATAGIGRAAAEQLAAQGAHVLVHGRDAERGAEVVDGIQAAGGSARFVSADLTDAAGALQLAEEAGEVDILVNNAGIFEFTGTADTTAASFDRHYAVNVRAPYLLVGALAPGMVARGRGSIVNVSSVVATVPMTSGTAYASSKAALELLTRSWAAEFGSEGVRVNAIAPGPVYTNGTAAMEAEIAVLGRATVAGRAAQPKEIAETISFLASPRATYVNGAVVGVHGGARGLLQDLAPEAVAA